MFAIALFTVVLAQSTAVAAPGRPNVQVAHSFHFTVPASLDVTAPLFGPEGERDWGDDSWQPAFVYPQPAVDVQGAVFTTPHGQHRATWVNTVFDLKNGRMQYVVFVPERLVTVIDVRLTANGPAHTSADVTYTRTALDPALNETVTTMSEHDASAGPEWQQQVMHALAKRGQLTAAPASSHPR